MKEDLDAIETVESPKGETVKAQPANTAPAKPNTRPEKPAEPPKASPSPRPTRPRLDDDEEDNEGFFQKHRIKIIIAAVVLAIGGWMALSKPSGPSAPARRPEPAVVMIKPLPPPPAPTPPPKVIPPPPKDEVKKEDKVSIPEDKPLDKPAPPKPVEKPPEGLGTNVKGPGAGTSGLNQGGGNGMLGGTGTGPGGGGSAGAWYAGQVQTKVAEALRNHRKTRNASISGIKFTVSVDATGNITGVKLIGSTGDVSIDEAIKSEALNGIRLQAPPPGGKPMTVTMVLNARRPK
jgi:periplasmic protein TonB